MKIAVLTTNPAENFKLEEAAKNKGHQIIFIDQKETLHYISEYLQGNEGFYTTNKDGGEPRKLQSGEIDVVIPRMVGNEEFCAAILRFIVDNIGAFCPNDPWLYFFASNKLYTLQKAAAAGILLPKQIIAEDPSHFSWIMDQVQLPVIVKAWNGSKISTIGICDSIKSANSLISFSFHSGLKIIVESFIETGGIDYSAWVIGGQVPFAMKRMGGHGGKYEKAELSKADQELCVNAARSIGLDVAGIVFIKDPITGKSYILDISPNPDDKIIDPNGQNPFENLIDYCEENMKKKDTGPGNNLNARKSSNTDLPVLLFGLLNL